MRDPMELQGAPGWRASNFPGATVRARVVFSGRVQGVGLREHALECADRLGVTGWVRNLPGARVEAVLEGRSDSVEAMLALLRAGPPRARVTAMDVHWERYRAEFTRFSVAR